MGNAGVETDAGIYTNYPRMDLLGVGAISGGELEVVLPYLLPNQVCRSLRVDRLISSSKARFFLHVCTHNSVHVIVNGCVLIFTEAAWPSTMRRECSGMAAPLNAV